MNEGIGKYGGTLRRIERSYQNFRQVTRYMNEHLFAISPPSGTHLYPNLALSVDISDDYTTYKIILRKGVKWSDGAEFTTEDIRYAWEDVVRYSPDPKITPDSLTPGSLKFGLLCKSKYKLLGSRLQLYFMVLKPMLIFVIPFKGF
jgi:ABC-type transport system substrate-binding protein